MNSYAGRPGEWSRLERKEVLTFVSSGCTTLVIHKHKTKKSHGKLGRYVPDGNREAMRKVLDIHSNESKFFMYAPKGNGKLVQAANLLRTWGSIYTPDFQVPKPTLMRKWFHTEDQQRDAEDVDSFKQLCDMDGHNAKTRQKFYVATVPEKRTKIAQATFQKHVGQPVEWPSAEELLEGREQSEERIASFWRRRVFQEDRDDKDEPEEVADDDTFSDTSADNTATANTAKQEAAATEEASKAIEKDTPRAAKRLKGQSSVEFIPRPADAPPYVDTTVQAMLSCAVPHKAPPSAPEAPPHDPKMKQLKIQHCKSMGSSSATLPKAAAKLGTQRKGKPCPFTQEQQDWLAVTHLLTSNEKLPTNEQMRKEWIPQAVEQGILDAPGSKRETLKMMDQIRAYCKSLAIKI